MKTISRNLMMAMDRDIRATCKILECVAKKYPRSSNEREAIHVAAEAYIYLSMHIGLKKSYHAFRRNCSKTLTKAQQRVLKDAGVVL